MDQTTTWLIANWKMNGTAAEVQAFAEGLAAETSPVNVRCIFCPPTPYLARAAELLKQTGWAAVGAQNCHAATKGAHTGEVSAAMLRDVGCTYVIVGHSERRQAGETDGQVVAKAKSAIEGELLPVICIGESEAEYMADRTKQVLNEQIAPLKELVPGSYLIAYEPVWAIGSGKTPSTLEIQAVHAHIKSVLGSATPVLYGGSVNTGNAQEILRIPEVSGALIGGASLSLSNMVHMIDAVNG